MVWNPPLHPLESLGPVPTLMDSLVACAPDEHLAAYGAGAVVDTTGSHSMAEGGKDTRELLRQSIKEKKMSESKGSNSLSNTCRKAKVQTHYQTRVGNLGSNSLSNTCKPTGHLLSSRVGRRSRSDWLVWIMRWWRIGVSWIRRSSCW
jgi:hypothetical protein